MTVPQSYASTEDYIQDSLSFLKTYQWLYNYNNTHVILNNTLSNFPSDWLSCLKSISYGDLNKLVINNLETDNLPESLNSFLKKVDSLQPDIQIKKYDCEYDLLNTSSLSTKKLHEVLSLGPVIDDICKENSAEYIFDVGSGLGYLSHMLNYKYRYKVLGIECNTKYIKSAYENQANYYPQCKSFVNFIHHFIHADSKTTLEEFYKEHFYSVGLKSGCLVGLHACADLSVTILDLFTKLDFLKCLVIMPCCYHRLRVRQRDNCKEYFEHFPASQIFKTAFDAHEAEQFLRTPFLRLACQQSVKSFVKMNDEEHDEHARNFMHRAILQDVAESVNCEVKRLKRKSGKSRKSDPDQQFSAYLNNLKNTHRLVPANDGDLKNKPCDIDDESFLRRMREKWNEHKGNCRLFEALAALQASLQYVCENLVLLDRVEFLKERGFHCEVRKVTNESLSPRCYALFAVKN